MGLFTQLFDRWVSPEPPESARKPLQPTSGSFSRGIQTERSAPASQPESRATGPKEPRPEGRQERVSADRVATEARPAAPSESPLNDHPEPSEDFESSPVGELMDDLFDNVLGAGSESQRGPAGAPEEDESLALVHHDVAEAREMFGGVAAGYVGPVRQFHARLKAGPVSTEWVEICRPAMDMVARSARSMGLESLVPFLDRYSSLLSQASEDEGNIIDGAIRHVFLQTYSELAEVMPEAFGIDEELDQKDAIIVHSLLRQIRDVGAVTLDKIFGAGITSLDMLEAANATDLAVTTGVPMHLCERICQCLQEYLRKVEALQAFNSPSRWLQLLDRVVAELEEHHGAYRKYADVHGDEPDDAKKRRLHRRARRNATLKVEVLLAEMGEVRLVDEIRRLSVDGRIGRLRDFVASHGKSAERVEETSADEILS